MQHLTDNRLPLWHMQLSMAARPWQAVKAQALSGLAWLVVLHCLPHLGHR